MSQRAATKLERRARMLLRAYPADYRRDRAEEIIGTLLDATPADRSFPSARDGLALIAGGVHARAAGNRRLSAAANLRLALLLGLSMFLVFNISFSPSELGVVGGGVDWLAMAAGFLMAAVALAPWLGRRMVTIAVVLPAAALAAYQVLSMPSWRAIDGNWGWLAGILIAMGALAALSGGPSRLPRSWLWLPCVALAAVAAGSLLFASGDRKYGSTGLSYAILLLAAVVACWLATDARPAFGLIAAVLLAPLLADVDNHLSGIRASLTNTLVFEVLPLAIGLALLLPVAWRLRRQSAPRPRALEEGDL